MCVASKYINYILLVCFFGAMLSQSLANTTTELYTHHNGKNYQTHPEQILLLGSELLAEDPEWGDEKDELYHPFVICNLLYYYLNSTYLSINSKGIITSNHDLSEPSPAYIIHGVFRV